MKRKYIFISIILILLITMVVGVWKIYLEKRKIAKFQYNGYEFEYDKTKWPKYINYDPDKGGKFIISRGLRFYNKEHYYVHLKLEHWDKTPDKKVDIEEIKKDAYLVSPRVIFNKSVEIVCDKYECSIYEKTKEGEYKDFSAEILGYKNSTLFISSPKELSGNTIDNEIIPFLDKIFNADKREGN